MRLTFALVPDGGSLPEPKLCDAQLIKALKIWEFFIKSMNPSVGSFILPITSPLQSVSVLALSTTEMTDDLIQKEERKRSS